MKLKSLLPFVFLGALPFLSPAVSTLADTRPNILVVYAEDISTELGCYGFSPVYTPNLDQMASEGVLFTSAYTTTPVCSTSRSAMFTGMYPSRIGAQNHRTREPDVLPDPIQPISYLFQDAGYLTMNIGGKIKDPETGLKLPTGALGSGKMDLNFAEGERPLFDIKRGKLTKLPEDSPWIGWLTIQESHKGAGWPLSRQVLDKLVDPEAIELPPYWPDHPVARDEFANYLDALSLADQYFGEVLASLEASGQADRTIVLFIGDNGRCLFRGKQFLYDPGIHVPLIIRYPDGRFSGTTNDDFITGIDIPAILLGLANLPVPGWMDGRNLLDPSVTRRDHVITIRDRCDMAIERMRAVRDRQYKYIRNFLPAIPYMQWNPYKEREYPTWNLLLELKAKGRLTPEQLLFTAPFKPIEELYDLAADPHEVHNLAINPEYSSVLNRMRGLLDEWLAEAPDDGATLEDPLTLFPFYFGNGLLPENYNQINPIYKDPSNDL